jgi:hypothetical protein
MVNKSQFGFWKSKSKKEGTNIIIKNITENLKKIKYNHVLLDLSKASNYIEHNILLHKLYKYGACGIPH